MSMQPQLIANRPNAQADVPVTDTEPFNALLDRIHEEMKPATEHECFLVDQMTYARWKLERIQRSEDELLERVLLGEPVEAKLTLMMRCAAAAERSYYKAYREFTQSRNQSPKTDQPAQAPPLKAVAPPAPKPELASFRKIEQPSLAPTSAALPCGSNPGRLSETRQARPR